MACNLSQDEKQLFKSVKDGDINEIKRLINDSKTPVDCVDENGFTPLQRAACDGSHDICKLLLDSGAEVNAVNTDLGLDTLSLAAIGTNDCDTISLLLEHGADTKSSCTDRKSAAELAANLGKLNIMNVINNFIARSAVDYLTEVRGLDTEPKIPLFLSEPLKKLIVMPNIHPVRLLLHVLDNEVILLNLRKTTEILYILSEKLLRENYLHYLSFKYHHIGFAFSAVLQLMAESEANLENGDIPDKESVDDFIRSWLVGKHGCGISEKLEKFIRNGILNYPFTGCHVAELLKNKLAIGTEPNSLIMVIKIINGPNYFNELNTCATCWEQNTSKRCAACKSIRYCDKTCQKLDWSNHKKSCIKKV